MQHEAYPGYSWGKYKNNLYVDLSFLLPSPQLTKNNSLPKNYQEMGRVFLEMHKALLTMFDLYVCRKYPEEFLFLNSPTHIFFLFQLLSPVPSLLSTLQLELLKLISWHALEGNWLTAPGSHQRAQWPRPLKATRPSEESQIEAEYQFTVAVKFFNADLLWEVKTYSVYQGFSKHDYLV